MVKRKPLKFDNAGLADDLKESAGKGVNALFSPTPVASYMSRTGKEPETSRPISKPRKMKPMSSRTSEPKQVPEVVSRNLDTYISRNLSRNLDIYLDYLRPYLIASGIQVNFNYPQELIDKFDDLIFELNRLSRKKNRKQKITKTKVLVAALAYIIWDHEVNKKDSVLQRLIEKENE